MPIRNPYSENHSQAAERAQLVINFLDHHQLPHTPINYHLVYDFISGRNSALTSAMDALFSQNSPPSRETLWQLYQQFYHSQPTTETDQSDLLSIISGIRQDLHHINSNLTGYADQLNQYAPTAYPPNSTEAQSIELTTMLEYSRTIGQWQQRLEDDNQLILREIEAVRQELDLVRAESQIDSLTGVLNRRVFDLELENQIIQSQKDNSPVCILLGDIDHFKEFNDQYGHLIGDKILRFIATMLKSSLKGQDTVARYGGEEFAIILPGTKLNEALIVAEKIRSTIAMARLKRKSTGQVFGTIQISLGVTQLTLRDTPTTLIDRADKALYQAKRKGRNRVEPLE